MFTRVYVWLGATLFGTVVESPEKVVQAERAAREAEENARKLELEVLEAQQREKEKVYTWCRAYSA